MCLNSEGALSIPASSTLTTSLIAKNKSINALPLCCCLKIETYRGIECCRCSISKYSSNIILNVSSLSIFSTPEVLKPTNTELNHPRGLLSLNPADSRSVK